MMVGGITFLTASLVAVFRPEAAKTVSCSTVASMGLIVACGGIGSAEAVAAGILLLLLHGVSKALMVGQVQGLLHLIMKNTMEDRIFQYGNCLQEDQSWQHAC